MSPRARTLLFVIAAAVLAAELLAAAGELPRFGARATRYATVLNQRSPSERQVANVPTGITFDYRGFDTLGEEFVVFAAAAGVARVIKHGREEAEKTREDSGEEHEVDRDPSAAVRALAAALGAAVALLGLDIIAHGHITPGSGFQGGVVLSAAWLLVYLGYGARAFHRAAREEATDAAEALGAAGYGIIGIAGLAFGGQFLANFIAQGKLNELLSTGTVALIDAAVGCEVTAAFVMLYAHFLDVARTEPARRTE